MRPSRRSVTASASLSVFICPVWPVCPVCPVRF